MGFINRQNIRYTFIPYFYRNNVNNAVFDAYSSQLDTVNDKNSEFYALRNITIYSAEKILLEAYCNDVYDPSFRRIFITQQVYSNDIYLGLDSESPDYEVFLGLDSESPTYDLFLFKDGEGSGSKQVIVNVPFALSASNDMIKQGVQNYLRAPAVAIIQNF